MIDIKHGDAAEVMRTLETGSVDLSVWSPPYFVGKAYEQDLTFDSWQALLGNVLREHHRVVKPGGFVVVNVADILCFPDPTMPRFQADNVRGKKQAVTREDVIRAKTQAPHANRKELATMLGCSEQTVQRRLEGNNVRGGKQGASSKIKLTSEMIVRLAEQAQLYLYDQRIWHKDPCWQNSRWHSNSYRAVDEFERVLAFWRPGVTFYDRRRLHEDEWGEWGSRGVWRISSVARNGERHECEFPYELVSRIIRLYSSEGETVLDPFLGSGTTAVAAKQLGRACIGIDKEKKYVEVAKRRLDAAPASLDPWSA